MNVWIEIFGWVGSALLIVSLLQGKMLTLRVINSVASAMLVLYNVLVETWPMVAMNAAVIVINAWHIWRILRERRAERDAAEDAGAPETATSPR
jgi:membrane protein implicated in regulation of membrane protease activity